jgi:hypothetical protein
MQGELDCSRKLPPAKSANTGSFVILPETLLGCGQLQQEFNMLLEKFSPMGALL